MTDKEKEILYEYLYRTCCRSEGDYIESLNLFNRTGNLQILNKMYYEYITYKAKLDFFREISQLLKIFHEDK